MLVDREGCLWVGTRNGGLSQFTSRTLDTAGVPDEVRQSEVTSLIEDAAGAMWFALRDRGVVAQRSDGARPQVHPGRRAAERSGVDAATRPGRTGGAARRRLDRHRRGPAPLAGRRHPRPGHLAGGGDVAVPRSPRAAVDRGQRGAGPAVPRRAAEALRGRRRAAAPAGAQPGGGSAGHLVGGRHGHPADCPPQRRTLRPPRRPAQAPPEPGAFDVERPQRHVLAQRRPFRPGAVARDRREAVRRPAGVRRRDAVPDAGGRRRRLLGGDQQGPAAHRPRQPGRRRRGTAPGTGGDLLRHHRSPQRRGGGGHPPALGLEGARRTAVVRHHPRRRQRRSSARAHQPGSPAGGHRDGAGRRAAHGHVGGGRGGAVAAAAAPGGALRRPHPAGAAQGALPPPGGGHRSRLGRRRWRPGGRVHRPAVRQLPLPGPGQQQRRRLERGRGQPRLPGRPTDPRPALVLRAVRAGAGADRPGHLPAAGGPPAGPVRRHVRRAQRGSRASCTTRFFRA